MEKPDLAIRKNLPSRCDGRRKGGLPYRSVRYPVFGRQNRRKLENFDFGHLRKQLLGGGRLRNLFSEPDRVEIVI